LLAGGDAAGAADVENRLALAAELDALRAIDQGMRVALEF